MDGRVPSMPSTFGYSFEAIESIPNLKIDIYRYLNSPDLIQIYSKVLFPGQFKPSEPALLLVEDWALHSRTSLLQFKLRREADILILKLQKLRITIDFFKKHKFR